MMILFNRRVGRDKHWEMMFIVDGQLWKFRPYVGYTYYGTLT